MVARMKDCWRRDSNDLGQVALMYCIVYAGPNLLLQLVGSL